MVIFYCNTRGYGGFVRVSLRFAGNLYNCGEEIIFHQWHGRGFANFSVVNEG